MAATLQDIRVLVRQLTRNPDEDQLTTTELDKAINTFYLYDFPEELRLESLLRNLVFYTEPYVDTYGTSTVVTDPLYNFKNRYITTHNPIYVNGYQLSWSQDQSGFYATYPKIAQTQQVATGNGAITTFTQTVTATPFLQNQVLISSSDSSGAPLQLIDYPVSAQVGALGLVGIPQTLPSPYGTVNYITGAITAVFPVAPGNTAPVYIAVTPYSYARPLSVLYFNDEFVFRPVPDKVYRVELQVYVQPTEFMNDPTAEPHLAQWWQYIAYGAARKIFQSRMDQESLSKIEAEFNRQENLVNRKTIVQQTKDRSPTIYVQQTSGGAFPGGPGVGPWPYYF